MNEQSINRIIRKNLRELPFFDSEKHLIRIYELNRDLHVDYLTKTSGIPDGTTHFFLQIGNEEGGKIGYLVEIELDERRRGRGEGWSLYESIEGISRNLGCNLLRQTPSGYTFKGESRENYLMRRGYKKVPNCIEVEKIL